MSSNTRDTAATPEMPALAPPSEGLPGPGAPLRLAVVGAGIGRNHVAGALSAGLEIVALCDLDLDRATSLARAHDIEPLVTRDFHAVISDPAIEAISVCTPNALHEEMTVAALRAGKHVLCEKPLALNARGALAIARAAREADRVCAVSHVLRFRDDVRALKARASEVGPLYYARALGRRVNGIPGWGGWFTRREVAGGGTLIDAGIHLIDLCWWMAGCPRPLRASAVTHAAFGPHRLHLGAGGEADPNGVFDVEDLCAGMVRCAEDFSIHFESSWAIEAPSDARECSWHGQRGALLWNDRARIVRAGDIEELSEDGAGLWTNEMAHFARCVRGLDINHSSAESAVTLLSIIDALYASASAGHEVEVQIPEL